MAELIQLEVIVVMLCTGFGNLVLEKVTKWSINHSHIIKKSHIPTFTYDHLSSHQSSSINQHQQHHVSTSYIPFPKHVLRILVIHLLLSIIGIIYDITMTSSRYIVVATDQ